MRSIATIALTALVGAWATSPAAAQADSANLKYIISEAANMEPTVTEDGVVRLGWLREDVSVKISGMKLEPDAGLGSWAAFKRAKGGAMVMGDTVVFEDEITPALDAALANGLSVTALHNHFIFDDPPVYFMHVSGVGEPHRLAAGIRNTWDAIKAVREKHPRPQRQFPGKVPNRGDLDAGALASVLGTEGSVKNGVVKFSFDREGQMAGIPITPWGYRHGRHSQAATRACKRLATPRCVPLRDKRPEKSYYF